MPRNYRYARNIRYSKKKVYRGPRTRMGKTFRTRNGRIGCYKYVGNRRVAFVPKRRY